MAQVYNEIGTSRTASGKLWTASMSLDHLGNDWAVIGGASIGLLPSETIPGTGSPAWGTRISFDMYFPTAWDLDDTYDTSLVMRLVFEFYISAAAGDDGGLRVIEGANIGTTASWTTAGVPMATTSTLSWTEGAVPTGKTTISVQALPNTSPDAFTYTCVRRGTCRLEAWVT